MVNEALAEYNRVIPRARGEAQQAILQPKGTRWNASTALKETRSGSPQSMMPTGVPRM